MSNPIGGLKSKVYTKAAMKPGISGAAGIMLSTILLLGTSVFVVSQARRLLVELSVFRRIIMKLLLLLSEHESRQP